MAPCHDGVTTFCQVAAAVFSASFSACNVGPHGERRIGVPEPCGEMTAMGTACACMMLAQECRASCSRICLTLAAMQSSRQKSLSVSG